MEKKKYINPEDVKYIDPSMFDSVILTNGSLIKVFDQGFKGENAIRNYNAPKNINENIFRGRNQRLEEVILKGEATEEKKEVLRGPNGMPLLGDIISGGNFSEDYNNTNINVPPVEKIPVSVPTIPIANQSIKKPIQPIPQPPSQIPVYIQPQRPIIPQNKTQMKGPIIPKAKGPLNPSVKPIIPPKPRIIPPKPVMNPPPRIIPPQAPKVIMPMNKTKNNMIIHPGKKYMPIGSNIFRNRKFLKNMKKKKYYVLIVQRKKYYVLIVQRKKKRKK